MLHGSTQNAQSNPSRRTILIREGVISRTQIRRVNNWLVILAASRGLSSGHKVRNNIEPDRVAPSIIFAAIDAIRRAGVEVGVVVEGVGAW